MKSILKSIGYVLAFILIQILIQMVFSAVAVANGACTESDVMEYITNNTLLLSVITNMVTLLSITIFRKIRKKPSTGMFCFQNVTLNSCLICAITALAFSLCFSLVTYRTQFENAKLISQSYAYFSEAVPLLGPVMTVVALLISAPIVEEYICRGILFAELEKKFSANITIILSAVIFGVIHIIAGGIILALGATLMGLIFGYIYQKTKSLAVAVIAHSCANLSDFILQLIPNLNTLTIIIGSFICAVITIVGLFYLNKGERSLVTK